MEEQRTAMQEMEDVFSTIRIEDEEQGGLMYGENAEDLGEIDTRWCLVGRFLTDSSIDFQAMQHKMASLWKPGRGMYVKQLDVNRFIFQFYHELDIKRVVEGSPWTFGRFQLIFERLKEGDNPRTIQINKLDIWVQLHGMSSSFMSQRVVTDIGNYIGLYIEGDVNNFQGVWREFLRVRVSIALDVPIKRRMKLKKSESNWCWVNFKYERMPTFCFICGMIGHAERFCERLFDTPLEKIEKPYGPWMRAEPRRKMHTMGAKWLRPGGTSPVVVAREEDGGGGSKFVTEIVAHKSQPSEKSEIPTETGVHDRRIIIGGIKGAVSAKNQDSTTVPMGGNYFENHDVENNEVILVNLKRQRVGQDVGPIELTTQKDDVMITSEGDVSCPKNYLLAGAAVQARHTQ